MTQGYIVHGEHSTAMRGNGNAQVAFPTDRSRCLDTTGGYATSQGGTVVHAYGLGKDDTVSGTLGAHAGGGRTTDIDGRGAYAVVPIDMAQASRSSGATGVGTPGTGVGEDGDPSPSLGRSRATPAVATYVKAHRARSKDDHESWEQRDVNGTLSTFDVTGSDVRATTVALGAQAGPCGCCPVDPSPDSPRYKAAGNAVTVPVITWIGRRLMSSLFSPYEGAS